MTKNAAVLAKYLPFNENTTFCGTVQRLNIGISHSIIKSNSAEMSEMSTEARALKTENAESNENVSKPELVPHRNVLIVNPNLAERRCYREKLRERMHRCKTYGASTGVEALSLVEGIEIDCVLLSQFLPDFREFDLIGHLTNCTTLASIPVVALGDLADAESETQALNAGASAYIAKSAGTAEQLSSTISQTIANARLMRVVEIQNRQIQLLSKERQQYIHRTDDLAHELLTPLAAIQEFVSLVFDGVAGPINDEQCKHLAYARGGCDVIRTTVESLLVSRDLERILAEKS